MTSRHRRAGALLSVVGALAVSLLVATPASAQPPRCDVFVPTGGAVILLREDDPWTVSMDCGAESVSDQDLQVTVGTGPGHGEVGPVSFRPGRSGLAYGYHEVTYDPEDDYVGPDRFTVTVSDGTGSTDVVVDLRMDTNRRPSCNQRDPVYDHIRVDESWSMTLTCDDLDEQDTYTLEPAVGVQPQHGSIEVSVAEDRSGFAGLTVTYTPDPGFTGPDRFVAGVTDGDLTDLHEFYLHVADGPWCEQTPPFAVRGGDTHTFHAYCTTPLHENPTIEIVDQPGLGDVAVQGQRILYTADARETGPDSFTYRASNSTGVSNLVTQEVGIVEDPETVPPVITLTLADQSPARAARRGVIAYSYANEPVLAQMVFRVPVPAARRLGLTDRIIGRITDDSADITRWQVPLTPEAARAVRDVRRLPLRVTLRATDSWGNQAVRVRRAVLR